MPSGSMTNGAAATVGSSVLSTPWWNEVVFSSTVHPDAAELVDDVGEAVEVDDQRTLEGDAVVIPMVLQQRDAAGVAARFHAAELERSVDLRSRRR